MLNRDKYRYIRLNRGKIYINKFKYGQNGILGSYWGAHSVTMVESVLAAWTPVVAIITGVSSVQCRTVCRVYVPGAMDLAATEDIDDILNCIRTD